jgi:hypothetical protein
MFVIPGRFSGPGNGPTLLAPPPARPLLSPPQRSRVVPVAFLQHLYVPGSAVGDTWGAVQIPAQPAPQFAGYSPVLAPGGSGFLPPGDPALAIVLSFLYAFLVTDGNSNAPWTQATGYPLINSEKSLFAHNPSDWAFNESYLPALFLWRDDNIGGKFEREADDWEIETSTWTMLWALPLGDQFRQKDRSQFANQFVKSVVTGIERGVTPSWLQPGDSNPDASTYGSYLGQYLNMVRFRALSWKRSKIRIALANVPKNTAESIKEYPAIEMRFEARERLKPDLRRYPGLNCLEQSINNPVTGSRNGNEHDN